MEKKSIVEVFLAHSPKTPILRLDTPERDSMLSSRRLIRAQQSVLVFTNVRSAAEQIGLRFKGATPRIVGPNRNSPRVARSQRPP